MGVADSLFELLLSFCYCSSCCSNSGIMIFVDKASIDLTVSQLLLVVVMIIIGKLKASSFSD